MNNKQNPDRGRKLPETIDPGDTVCAKVLIPNDVLYIAAFWDAYEELTHWLAWERGGTRAKQAAAVWRAAFDEARIDWENGVYCGVNDVRQKPDYPCILQKYSGGEWVDFADLRLCVPKLRLFGGKIQQDTTGSGDWQDASETGDFDQKNGGEYHPQWETVPEGETAECLSSRNVATMLNYVLATFCGTWAGAEGFAGALAFLVGFAAAWLTDGIAAPLFALIDTLALWEFNQFANAGAMVLTDDLTELMECLYDDTGYMSPENHIELITRFDQKIATLSVDYELVRWRFTKFYVQWLGPVGMTLAGKAWGIQSYDCDRVCGTFYHLFDFETNGQQGWVPTPYAEETTVASWASNKWESLYAYWIGHEEQYNHYIVEIRKTFPSTTITKIRFTFSVASLATNRVARIRQGYLNICDWQDDYQTAASMTPNDTVNRMELVWEGTYEMDNIRCQVGAAPENTSQYIYTVEIWGLGPDPFEE
jgi:hypothetical protein